jgi:prolyl oligopeptidase
MTSGSRSQLQVCRSARSRAGGAAPILIRIDVHAGHGFGKPVSKQIEEAVDVMAFLLQVLGDKGD